MRTLLPHRTAQSLCAIVCLAFFPACGSGGGTAPLAFITNGVDPFWTIAAAGVAAAEREFNVSCEVRMPADSSVVEQKRIVEDLLTRGVEGIAISPIDGVNQNDLLNRAASRAQLITHDSDAPGSQRLCYIGVDNYAAGRMAGQLVKEALPEGGSLMIFVGRLEQENARLRRQGCIDELLDRSEDPTRYDAPDELLESDKYQILGTRTDLFDRPKAKANAEDALARHGDLDCMVGLFAYNIPCCIEALKTAGKLGQVQLVSFDEADATLAGIEGGTVHGTVVQNPYEYGWQSVRILAGLLRGDQSVLPVGGVLEVPARIVRKADLEEFWEELKARLEVGKEVEERKANQKAKR